MVNDLPTYPYWDQIPPHLKTRTQLNQLGLKPNGPVRAQIRYKARGKFREYDLYDRREAALKRTFTEAQWLARRSGSTS